MQKSEALKSINVVILRINKEKYLLEVKNVKEIYIPGEKIVPVPLSDKTIVGVIDIRGEIFSILSLRRRIYRNETIHDISDKKIRLLLLEFHSLKIALLVDEVIGVKEVPISIFQERTPIIETDLDFKFIKSIGILDDETLILLDLEMLISSMNIDVVEASKMALEPLYTIQPVIETRSETQVKDEVDIPRIKAQKSSFQKTYNLQLDDTISPLKAEKIVLNAEQEDVLKEIGNIGCGNAVTALSKLVKKKINVNLTNVGIIQYNKLSEQFGGPNQKVCGIFSQLSSYSQSTIFQAFELKPLLKLMTSLAGQKTKINPDKVQSKEDLDDYAISTITEMGNIMAGHYASALADLIGMKIMLEVPEFTLTDAGLLGDFLSQEIININPFVILIKTTIEIVDIKLNGVFFFIPDVKTLHTIFDKLNIKYDKQATASQASQITEITDLKNLNLTDIQKDALKEVGNIGAGNAANALAIMLNKKVVVDVPEVEMVELDKFSNKISKKNEKLMILWSNVTGQTRATILLIIKMPDILKIMSILIDEKSKADLTVANINKIKDFPDIYIDAIGELGHILASNYVSAMGDLLSITFMTEPPDMSVDVGKQLFKILKEEIGLLKKLSLVITTNIIITDIKITGTFLFIPDVQTLHELLNALQNFYD